jgi:hypothetical protein
MTKQVIFIGTVANDGSGDSIRDAMNKVNLNFDELYGKLSGTPDYLTTGIDFDSTGILLLGTQATYTTRVEPVTPTANQTIYVPDSAGTVTLRESKTYKTVMTHDLATDSVVAVDLNQPLTIFNRGTAILASLDSGETGQVIKFINVGAGSTTLTPNVFAQGTSINMNQDASCELVWGTSKWHLFGNTDSDSYLTIS